VLTPSPIKKTAAELGLEVATPEKSRDPEFVARIGQLNCDLHFVAAYGQILPVPLLESARQGSINLHGSILPAYRGAAPIQRAIMAGDQETGVTLMQMAKGMDTGDIIAIQKTAIGRDETFGELHTRLADIAGEMATEWAPRLCVGEYTRKPQDHYLATNAPKILAEDRTINWESEAYSEYNRFRGITPSPGAILDTKFGFIKVLEARLGELTGSPGTLVCCDPVEVAVGGGALRLLTVQPEGRSRMSAAAWLLGTRLRIGDSVR
jgi:methionyl-tRNA formyltransferase